MLGRDCCSDEETPDWIEAEFAKQQGYPFSAVRKSPKHFQKAHLPRNKNGFRRYLAAEKELLRQVRLSESEDRSTFLRRQRKSARPQFVETCGAVQLFSMSEVACMYDDAEIQLGKENREYVENQLRSIAAKGDRRGLAKAPTNDQLLALRRRFPNASEVMDVIDRAAALSRLSPQQYFEMQPLLIAGDPGVGKTAVVQAIAETIKVSFLRIDIATLSTGSQLFGTSLTWSTGRTGAIYNRLAEVPEINPVLFLDELDKASGNYQSPVVPPLLSLLEQETSRCFRDEAIPIALNASNILWFATANDLQEISAPLLSRFTIVEMQRPKGEEAITVAREIYRAICKRSSWGKAFPHEPDRSVLQQLEEWTPRDMSRLLRRAFGEAAREGRTFLLVSDIPRKPSNAKRSVGFH